MSATVMVTLEAFTKQHTSPGPSLPRVHSREGTAEGAKCLATVVLDNQGRAHILPGQTRSEVKSYRYMLRPPIVLGCCAPPVCWIVLRAHILLALMG